MMSLWLATLLAIFISLFAAFVTLFFHELSHLVVIKILGGTIRGFAAWPSVVDGVRFIGYVAYDDVPINHRWHWVAHIAPVIKATIIGSFWLYMMIAVHHLLFPFFFWELFDIINWFWGFFMGSENTDGVKFKENFKAWLQSDGTN